MTYTSSFIGIPLAERHHGSFRQVLRELAELNGALDLAYEATPHITAYYMGTEPLARLREISEEVVPVLSRLRGVKIHVHGVDTFGGARPKVVFLRAEASDGLLEFRADLLRRLVRWHVQENNLPYQPHLTLARARDRRAQRSLRKTLPLIIQRFAQVAWKFPITEVAIYGVDSTKNPQHQEKIISLKI